jgi:hypothetical protein
MTQALYAHMNNKRKMKKKKEKDVNWIFSHYRIVWVFRYVRVMDMCLGFFFFSFCLVAWV